MACPSQDSTDYPPLHPSDYKREGELPPWSIFCELPLTKAKVEPIGPCPGFVDQMVREDSENILALVHENWTFPLTGASLYRFNVRLGTWSLAYKFEEPWIWQFALTDSGIVYAMVRDGTEFLPVPGLGEKTHPMVVIDLSTRKKIRTYLLEHQTMEPVYFRGSIWYVGFDPNTLLSDSGASAAVYELRLGADAPRKVAQGITAFNMAATPDGLLYARAGSIRIWNPGVDPESDLPLGRDRGMVRFVDAAERIRVLGDWLLVSSPEVNLHTEQFGTTLFVRNPSGVLELVRPCLNVRG